MPRPIDPIPKPKKDIDSIPGDGDLPIDFSIEITSPRAGAERIIRPGDNIFVMGSTEAGRGSVTAVHVSLDGGETFEPAAAQSGGVNEWSRWTFGGQVSASGEVKITARVAGEPIYDHRSIFVTIDGTDPVVNVTEVDPGQTVKGSAPPFRVTVKGTARDAETQVTAVEWRLNNGAFKSAERAGDKWTVSRAELPSVGSHRLTIRAADQAGNKQAETINIDAVDIGSPTLRIEEPAEDPYTEIWDEEAGVTVKIEGTASDQGAGVNEVQWGLNEESPEKADNVSGNWLRWRAEVSLPSPGEHQLWVEARDKAGNKTTKRRTLVATRSFTPQVEDITSPAAYLEELLAFAAKQIKSEPDGSNISRELLAETFFQPFDRLLRPFSGDEPSLSRAAASRPVHQARIGVEVLRRRLGRQPVEGEADYRREVYETLLRRLGVSYEEIRTARVADEAARRSLANRLGIDLPEQGPDPLAELFIAPEALAEADSEARLEQLFGLPATRQDPLAVGANPVVVSTLLSRQQARLRTVWDAQDHSAAGPDARPIIDPDIVHERDFADLTEGNTALDLWRERRSWVQDQLQQLRQLREESNGQNLLGAFNRLIQEVLGQFDLTGLAEAYRAGQDIAPELDQQPLALQPFLYLARVHELAAAGAILESEWADVYAILVQVRKRRQYGTWRAEEAGITLSPDFFKPPPADATPPEPSHWRASYQARRTWEDTLVARVKQAQALTQALQAAVDAAAEAALPGLRQRLIAAAVGADLSDSEAAALLSQRLLIDFQTGGGQQTTRLKQAIETLQAMFFALRAGRLAAAASDSPLEPGPAAAWTLAGEESEFDREWQWRSAYATWRANLLVFGYPENYLRPSLRPKPPAERPELVDARKPFWGLVDYLRASPQLTPGQARERACGYLADLREQDPDFPPSLDDNELADKLDRLELTEQLSEDALRQRRELVKGLFTALGIGAGDNPHLAPNYLQEIFYFAPLQIALQLQKAGHYLAALDWFQTVYAYHLPPGRRKIYHGLKLEEDLTTEYQRPTNWNPHHIVTVTSPRANAYTRFTLMSLVRCFLDFADSEFTRASAESIPKARSLYLTALDLLDQPALRPGANGEADDSLFPPNRLPDNLRQHAEMNLAKLRHGRNIAGLEQPGAPEQGTHAAAGPAPTPYRYPVLIERAKELVSLAQQIEAAYLSALEKRDKEAYTLLQAGHDLNLARAQVELQDLRVEAAGGAVSLARRQQERAQFQREGYEDMIQSGLNRYEQTMIRQYRRARDARQTAANWSALLQGGGSMQSLGSLGQTIGAAVGAGAFGAALGGTVGLIGTLHQNRANKEAIEATAAAQIAAVKAGFERRKQLWSFQKGVAEKNVQIGNQQIALAQTQYQIAGQELAVAQMQSEQAKATADFLANQFTNDDLYEWMSGVLSRVYSYFLQQATATAQLAQSQLAFQRQEKPATFIQANYWQPPSEAGAVPNQDGDAPDRRGLTGSARLLQDIYRLDQYAFETRQRKLQLSQTFSLARLAPFEFQRFRETGVLTFATSIDQFDQDFPGHYLRLIRRVSVSMVALIPPTRGVRASLTSAGISRVVTGDGQFQTAVVRRDPELIAFTSSRNATGLFELRPEGELLRPFEGSGVDTTWQLELPQAANPFDYRTIADVLFTVEYTALHSNDYRRQVIQQLDRDIEADRSFSFRDEFPDQWYDLHNPNQAAEPLLVRLQVERGDFPPHLRRLRIEQLLLYFAPDGETPVEIPVEHLHLIHPDGTRFEGGEAKPAEGVISTRRANGAEAGPGAAAGWIGLLGNSPLGEWELALLNTPEVRRQFEAEKVEDILFVITFTAQTPPWPA